MQIYSQKDVDKKALKGARIAILGYGSQGRAHALNLKDSGFDVVVGVRRAGASWAKAKKDGLKVAEPADAVDGAALVAFLTPGPDAEGPVQGSDRRHRQRRDDPVRARLQHPLQADQAAQGSRRRADRAERPRRPRAPPVPAGPRRAVPAWRSARTRPAVRRTTRSPMRTASAARAAACSPRPSPRRPRPICSANRSCCAAARPSWS